MKRLLDLGEFRLGSPVGQRRAWSGLATLRVTAEAGREKLLTRGGGKGVKEEKEETEPRFSARAVRTPHGREAADTGPVEVPSRSRVPGPSPDRMHRRASRRGEGTHHCTASPGSSWPASAGPVGGCAAPSPPRRGPPTA